MISTMRLITWYDKKGKDGQVPGISLGQWWDDDRKILSLEMTRISRASFGWI